MAAATSGSFPSKSFLWFIAGAAVLRLGSIAGSMFFPGEGAVPQLGRVFIPLGIAAALIVLNRQLLARDGFEPDALGLRPTCARACGFLAGAAAITLILAAVAGALWLLLPYHYQRGSLGFGALVLRAVEYLGGNFGEELIFRGYLLLVLQRHLGLLRALLITGILFGVFHLPGLAGSAATKMVFTTFLGGSLYACGFLLTETLWTALGMHVVGNIVLHHVLGLSGQPSVWTPVFDRPWLGAYDPGFVVWSCVLIPCVAFAVQTYRKRSNQAGLAGRT